MNRTEYAKEKIGEWNRRGKDPRIRYADEQSEALMLHAKAVTVTETAAYQNRCHIKNMQLPSRKRGDCHLGTPWPSGQLTANATEEGIMYNCFVNEKVEQHFVPQLEYALNELSGA